MLSKMIGPVLPWAPFFMSSMGRILIMLSVALWVERGIFGFSSASVRWFAFYGALAFNVPLVVQHLIVGSGLFACKPPDTNVEMFKGSFCNGSVSWAACGMRGWREVMEDAHVAEMLDQSVFPNAVLFAVLDGHGGKEVSRLASKLLALEVERQGRLQLAELRRIAEGGGGDSGDIPRWPDLHKALEEALPALDAKLRRGTLGLGWLCPLFVHPFFSMGTTACVVAVDLARREVICANIGDSRAILVRSGRAFGLSEDHKPENKQESLRIRNAGGQVVKAGPCHRVDGTLNLSRALGDFYLKSNAALPPEKQKVIAVPDTTRTPFCGGPQELLVVACDGLFEKRSNQDIADLVWMRLQKGMPLEQIGSEICHTCCARSFRGMPREEGTDNESIILVRLPTATEDILGSTGDSTTAAAGGGAGASAGASVGAGAGGGVGAGGGDLPFAIGTHVEIHGLESEAGRPLNGKEGVVEGRSAGTVDRLEVRLVSSSETKSIKATNLRALSPASPSSAGAGAGGEEDKSK